MKRICICGKVYEGDELWCSPRCEYIVEKWKTPIGQGMDLDRVIRIFGKQWDREHE